MSFENKTALVTGASAGIGYGIAAVFATAGANVAVAARSLHDLDTAVAGLPEQQRSALRLVVREGLSNREAAMVMGCSVKALEGLLVRARRQLRSTLQHHDSLDERR